MGSVIRFPNETQIARSSEREATSEPAMIIILPVIRIERAPEPSGGIAPEGSASGRKPRRPTSRS